jgi:zinc D-Ala-D-Ala carboxypeptidase
MKLGKYFTVEEMTHTGTGIPNVPTQAALANMRALVRDVLDPLREALGRPIMISSGYRSQSVNIAVGGSSRSQHCLGEAADFNVQGMSVAEVIAFIRKSDIPFDQLIDEFGRWVHISHGPRNRRQVLRARKYNHQTQYKEI